MELQMAKKRFHIALRGVFSYTRIGPISLCVVGGWERCRIGRVASGWERRSGLAGV